jgi:hypothetical protein
VFRSVRAAAITAFPPPPGSDASKTPEPVLVSCSSRVSPDGSRAVWLRPATLKKPNARARHEPLSWNLSVVPFSLRNAQKPLYSSVVN